MYKNAEGYRDETAWRAIIAVAREERIKRRKLQEDSVRRASLCAGSLCLHR